jgi:hypothetical protein
MASIAISRAYNPVDIDLWGAKFETIDVTRSGAKKAQQLEREIEEIREGDDLLDELVEKMGELMDIKLAAAAGGRSKASTRIRSKWKGDELTLGQLFEFFDAVQKAEGECNRPT